MTRTRSQSIIHEPSIVSEVHFHNHHRFLHGMISGGNTHSIWYINFSAIQIFVCPLFTCITFLTSEHSYRHLSFNGFVWVIAMKLVWDQDKRIKYKVWKFSLLEVNDDGLENTINRHFIHSQPIVQVEWGHIDICVWKYRPLLLAKGVVWFATCAFARNTIFLPIYIYITDILNDIVWNKWPRVNRFAVVFFVWTYSTLGLI